MSKKNSKAVTSNNKEISFEMTKEKYDEMKSRGIGDEAIPSVGVHRFRRRTKVLNREEAKMKITMYIDADVLSFFKKRAEDPHAAPYQTQINAELRRIMDNEESEETHQMAQTIADDETINRLADVLAEKLRDKIAA